MAFVSFFVLVLAIVQAGSVAAQPAAQSTPMTAELLEERVSDEIAKSGLVLSQRNLRLQIEKFGDRWMISLVDLVTSHEETKVAQLPLEREAAVAMMSSLVIELSDQVRSRETMPSRPKPASPAPAPLPNVYAERVQRDLDELAVLDSLRFESVYGVEIPRSIGSQRWLELRGTPDNGGDAPEHHRAGRENRVELYYQRHFMKDMPVPATMCLLWLDDCQAASTPESTEGAEESTSSLGAPDPAGAVTSTASTTSPVSPGMGEPAENGELVNAALFERYVPQQLMNYGVVLSRHNVRLHVEQLGDWWLISLVDITYKYDVRSTRLGRLPPDREAALATVTHVVANLDSQLGSRSVSRPRPRPPTRLHQPEPAVAQVTLPLAVRANERAHRQRAALRFKQQLLRFDTRFGHNVHQGLPLPERRWQVLRGEVPLDVSSFYEVVGRDDLVRIYHRRQVAAIGSYLLGSAIITASTISGFKNIQNSTVCNATSTSIGLPSIDCHTNLWSPLFRILGAYSAGVAVMQVGQYIDLHSEPIDRAEAEKLVKSYNRHLHRAFNLSAAIPSGFQNLRLMPYVASREAGMVVSSRF